MHDTSRRRVLEFVSRVMTVDGKGRMHGLKGLVHRVWLRGLRNRKPQSTLRARQLIAAWTKRDPLLQKHKDPSEKPGAQVRIII